MPPDFNIYEWEQALQALRERGHAHQKVGTDYVRIAESGLANIASMEVLRSEGTMALTKAAITYPMEQFGTTGCSVITTVNGIGADAAQLSTSASKAASAVASMNIATDEFFRSIQTHTPGTLSPDFYLKKPRQRPFTVEQLDVLLGRYDPALPAKRTGAWDTFHSYTTERLSQAANSMRDALRVIVAKLAANGLVEAAPWYAAELPARLAKDPKAKVRPEDRVRFLIHGVDAHDPSLPSVASQLERFVEGHDALQSIAHGKSLSTEEVRQQMETVEELMFVVLERHYRGMPAA